MYMYHDTRLVSAGRSDTWLTMYQQAIVYHDYTLIRVLFFDLRNSAVGGPFVMASSMSSASSAERVAGAQEPGVALRESSRSQR